MSTDEVGWLFVQQYYTTLYKDPASLYKFYKADSQAIHGAEGEPVTPILGQQGMQEFIQSAALNKCKVQVTSVESLAGIESSIVLQVLGELSNNNEPRRKFAQTFVLAKADKGYYVASDILKLITTTTEEEPESREASETSEPKEAAEASPVAEKPKATDKTSPKPREKPTTDTKITRDRSWAAAARTFVPLGVSATPQPQYIPIPMMPVPMPMGDIRQMHMMSPNLPVQYDVTSPPEQMNRYGPGHQEENSH